MRRLIITTLLATAALGAPAAADAAVSLQKVGDFSSPIHVASAPGDFSRLYVVERSGSVRVITGAGTRPEPFVTLSGVDTTGERGLLSIAFRPDFQSSRLLYAYYNDGAGSILVDELKAADPEHADPGYRRRTITIPHPGPTNHNGGTLMFGPDGHLYLAPGDGGGGQSANAQNLGSPLGKVLRIDPIPGGGYAVPGDNPFVGQPGRLPEIWAYGLRNPFRFSVDPVNGDLAIGDVGEGTTEEIDFAPAGAGAGRGANFGWDPCEGSFAKGSTTTPCPLAGSTLPMLEHRSSAGWHAIIGGYVVRDPSLPSLQGRYVYGDEILSRVYSAQPGLPRAQDDRELLALPHLSSFGLDAAGCLYATSLDGPVYRLVEQNTQVPCSPGAAGGLAPLDRSAPRLLTRTSRRQRVLRQRGTVGYGRCPTEPCTIAMSGRLRIGKLSYPLLRTTKAAAQNRRVKLRTRLTKRARGRLRSALRRHRKAVVDVAYRARDAAGNHSRLGRIRVRVRR